MNYRTGQRWGVSKQLAMFLVMVAGVVLLVASSSSSFGQNNLCRDDSDCGTLIRPAICDPLIHRCMDVQCTVRAHCPQPPFAEMPSICRSNLCEQVECVTAREHCVPGQVCNRSNKCGTGCVVDEDCARAGFAGVCGSEGICVESPPPREFAPIGLSPARLVFPTGFVTDITQAIAFDRISVTLPIPFENGDKAVIAGSSNGLGPIVIDNFLSINNMSTLDCKGDNACQGVGGRGDSCFGDFLIGNPEDGVGLDIATVLTPIPPIDVSTFIPHGSQFVLFELCDFGSIAGNTELWLVITPHP